MPEIVVILSELQRRRMGSWTSFGVHLPHHLAPSFAMRPVSVDSD